MLAQLLKNLYICTFFFFCTCGQTKAGSGHSDCKEVGHREKKRPSPLTSHNNKPIPTPQKLRQRCRPLPSGGAMMGWKMKTRYKHKSASFSTPYRKWEESKFADINTSLHIISIHFLSPQPINRFSSVQTRWLEGAGVSRCLSFTYIY